MEGAYEKSEDACERARRVFAEGCANEFRFLGDEKTPQCNAYAIVPIRWPT